jgi:hypothetical protein
MDFDTAEISHSHAQCSLEQSKPRQPNYTGKNSASGRNSLSTFLWSGYETAVFTGGIAGWPCRTVRQSHESYRGTALPSPYFLLSVYPCESVVPGTDSGRLLRRENQESVAGRAGSEYVSRADKHHAAGNGGAGCGHRTALGRDMINCFVITNHVVFPE